MILTFPASTGISCLLAIAKYFLGVLGSPQDLTTAAASKLKVRIFRAALNLQCALRANL